MITFEALLCSLFTVEAADRETYGNGHEDFHKPIWTVPDSTKTAPAQKDKEWLIYWYVCGTDIESDREYGDVTRCIKEIEAANISSGNVKILMQAGGTQTWKHPSFTNNNGKVGYYLYDNSHCDWQPLEALTPINPSDPKTLMSTTEGLTTFLEYGKKLEQQLYSDPGRIHRVFIFVDHGNGSLNGLCNDAYGDALQLTEMHAAFDKVWGNSPQNPPFDVVALDTCLMSTYETAIALEGTARYMVASQETIVGFVMFGYTGLLNELSSKPMTTAEDFGRAICDTYSEDAKLQSRKEFSTVITLSLIDVNKMPLVEAAYENFGTAAGSAGKYPFMFSKDDLDKFSSLANNNFAPKAQRDFYNYMFRAGNFNGRICNLPVTCGYPEENFLIIGAVPESQGNISSGEMLSLSKGDVVKPIFAAMHLNKKDFEKLSAKYSELSKLTDEQKIELLKELYGAQNFALVDNLFEIVIGDTVTLGKRPLLNGTYAYAFEFVNLFGGLNANSNMNAFFLMKDGEIVGSADIDDLESLSELED